MAGDRHGVHSTPLYIMREGHMNTNAGLFLSVRRDIRSQVRFSGRLCFSGQRLREVDRQYAKRLEKDRYSYYRLMNYKNV